MKISKYRVLISCCITFCIDNCMALNLNEASPQATGIEQFCPQPQELARVGDFWQVGKTWKSDTPSGGQKIVGFVGAQWIGVKVGKIICIYKEDNIYSFPVALITVNPVLVNEPTVVQWTNTQQGYKQCISNDVKYCVFYLQKEDSTENIYGQIRYNPPQETVSPFVE